MSFYKFNEEAALVANESEGGSKVLDTGVYDVTIVTASEAVASTGTTGIDWSLQVKGHKYPNMVYGMWCVKSDGSEIAFNSKKVQSLMGITGAKNLTGFTKSIETGNGNKDVTAYKELDGKVVKVAIKKILDIYNGEVTEKNEIEAFFFEDGKTYSEKIKKSEAKQVKWYEDSMKDKHTDEYKKFLADGEEAFPDLDEDGKDDSSEGSLL